MTNYNFHYCQKLIIFNKDWSKVFLARRYGEQDFDGTFSFIGGKMETTDESILAGLAREKSEEVGENFKIRVYPHATNNVFFRKSDGNAMILPHYIARHVSGEPKLNPEEYSEWRWVLVTELKTLEPKIPNIPDLVAWALKLQKSVADDEFVDL